MNFAKIDGRLFKDIVVLQSDKKIKCFVLGNTKVDLKSLLKIKNVHILNEYLFINSFYCLLTRQQIFSLSQEKSVLYISSTSTACCMMNVAKKVLNCNKQSLTGRGVTVAFIDTGIANHFDFLIGTNRIKVFKDFINDKRNCYDDNGHGTFVCGVCCGNGYASAGKYSGIAPKSEIIALKALDANGEANASKILDAMQWIYDNHKKYNIKVVTMSFGSDPIGASDPIMLGAEALWDDGVVIVSAAGNSGPQFQTIKSPGVSSKIITVGGIDDNRFDSTSFSSNYFEIADFSSRGPAMKRIKPDVVAPSVDIVSCWNQKEYVSLSGTSVSAPMIAGLCTLMLEKDSSLSPNQIKKALTSISQPLGFDKNEEGFGLPNFKNFVL